MQHCGHNMICGWVLRTCGDSFRIWKWNFLRYPLFATIENTYICWINPFSASPVFGQVQKFFSENLLLARFLCWRDISRDLFLAKTLNFFSYRSEKTGKSSHKWDIWTNDHNLDLAVGRTGSQTYELRGQGKKNVQNQDKQTPHTVLQKPPPPLNPKKAGTLTSWDTQQFSQQVGHWCPSRHNLKK